MSTSSSIFTGSSSYSNDFVNLIDRATAIASLPIKQLEADRTALTGESTALSGLDTRFQALQSAIDSVSNALSGSSYEAEVSDPNKLGVSLSDGAVEGNYSVDVVDPGAYASSLTSRSWITPAGAARTYRLSVGGVTYAVKPAANTPTALAAAINSGFGDKVRATVVNVGGAQSDYRISLQAVTLGDSKLSLWTGPGAPTSLQTQQTTGSDVLAGSETSQNWKSDPALTFQLSWNGQIHTLTPADNSAQSVADAINSGYGSIVNASVANVGTAEAPGYRIHLTATGAGNLQPDILADDGVSGPVSIQTQTAMGSDTRAVSRSASSWVTDTGPTLKYELSLGGVKYALAPADNSAAALVADINTKHGDKVQAAVVDLGTSTSHDYRVTLTAVAPGDLRPDLIVSEVDLQQQQTTGALAHYIVNNSGKDVTSTTRTVSIATGVNVTLLARDSGTPVNITVTRPTSVLSNALSSFADAYNAIVDELDKQRAAGGALSGQAVVRTLGQTLSGLTAYTGAGGRSMADLGLELDKTGHLIYSSFTLLAADLSGSSEVTSFLGSPTAGFLKAAVDALNSVESATSGMLSQARASVDQQIASLTDSIAEHQERVDRMTERLQQQMAAADALIAAMEQQYAYMSNMLSAMRSSAEQYK